MPIENFTNSEAVTLATTYNASISSTTAVTLNSGATYIEVSAVAQGIFLKWGATASSSTFDEYISPSTTRQYVIPTGKTTVQFIEAVSGAILIVIQK